MLKAFKYFYSEAWREKPGYVVCIFMSILLCSAQPFVSLILSKYILEELATAKRPEVLVTLALSVVIANFVIMVLLHFLKCRIAVYDHWFDNYFYNKIGLKSMTMDYSLTEEPDVLNQRRKACDGMAWYSGGIKGLSDCVQKLFSFILTFMGVVAIVAVKTPVLLVVAVFAVIGGSFAVWQTNKCYLIEFEVFPKTNRAFGYMTRDVLKPRCAKSIRLYKAAKMMREQFEKTMNKCSDTFKYTALKIGRWNCVGSVVNFLKNLCIYGYLGYKLVTGKISIGDFTLLSGSANTLKDSLQGVLNQFQDLAKKLKFMNEYVKYIEMKDTTMAGSAAIEDRNNPVIEFKDVSFKYPSSTDWVLKDVNIKIPAGQHLSIVGLNGAGKTTFIKLLCRLYEADKGEILLNGKNIKEYPYDEYIKELSVVFQDFKVFAMSVKDNILLGDSEREDKEALQNAYELGGLKSLLDTLPKGEDTQVYKIFDMEGIVPSGGELQKMAIARALYKDAPVVVLDEPTAALDPVAEYEVYRRFNDLVGGKTAIFISHRLSSCKFSDVIAVFADKTIKEYGTHDELVNQKDGLYREMFTAQAQYYA
ncbi:MAG: ABC transporter ATP-binding protein/permease [Lachnospiraceae bacterium]|nr:ABC transporter ATP-binding protein/permease [Lachnospiraceae bacterium]